MKVFEIIFVIDFGKYASLNPSKSSIVSTFSMSILNNFNSVFCAFEAS